PTPEAIRPRRLSAPRRPIPWHHLRHFPWPSRPRRCRSPRRRPPPPPRGSRRGNCSWSRVRYSSWGSWDLRDWNRNRVHPPDDGEYEQQCETRQGHGRDGHVTEPFDPHRGARIGQITGALVLEFGKALDQYVIDRHGPTHGDRGRRHGEDP